MVVIPPWLPTAKNPLRDLPTSTWSTTRTKPPWTASLVTRLPRSCRASCSVSHLKCSIPRTSPVFPFIFSRPSRTPTFPLSLRAATQPSNCANWAADASAVMDAPSFIQYFSNSLIALTDHFRRQTSSKWDIQVDYAQMARAFSIWDPDTRSRVSAAPWELAPGSPFSARFQCTPDSSVHKWQEHVNKFAAVLPLVAVDGQFAHIRLLPSPA